MKPCRLILEPGETNFDDFGIPGRPTKDQGRRALDILCELISEISLFG